jgi:uncharacterized protein (DUF58 family)
MSEGSTSRPDMLDEDLLRRLGRLDLVSRAIANAMKQGLRRSRLHGFSTEFSDHKAYVPGDDLRFLDWRIYGRTDRLLIRKYEAETSFESVLLLDASRSMAWRWRSSVTKLEYAVRLLAAIAFLRIENQDQVGLVVHDAAELRWLPPRSTRRQLDLIYEVLTAVQPGPARTFAALVGALAPMKKHRGQIVICSDLEEGEEEIAASLEMLAARDDEVVVIHLLDRAEIELPFEGATHLQDSESGEVLPVEVDDLRGEHDARVREFREAWKLRCEAWKIRHIAAHTGMGYVDVLLDLLLPGREERT